MIKTKQKKKKLKIALCCVLTVLIGLIVYAAAFFAIDTINNPNGIPMPFGFGASLVYSGSMEPEITVDDLVFITKPKELHEGDIVLYNTGKSNVLHRIVRIEGGTIVTKGDANDKADEAFSSDAVLGVYAGKMPGAGKVIRFVTDPPFVMLIVFLLMSAAVTWIFVEEHRENKRLQSIRSQIDSIKAENEELRKKL